MPHRKLTQPDTIRLGQDPRFGADLYGRPMQPQTIGRNSQIEFVYREYTLGNPVTDSPPVTSRLAEFRQQFWELLRRARDEWGLTAVEVETVRSRLEGYLQVELAEVEGVSRQAILSRFAGRSAPSGKRWGGIFNKAPDLVMYCERADRFRQMHGSIVHIGREADDV